MTDNLHGPNTNHSCNFELRDFDRVKVVKLPGEFYCCSDARPRFCKTSNTVFTIYIGAPQFPTILAQKLLTTFDYSLICIKTAERVANSVNPDKKPRSAASDQDQH